MFLDNPVQSDIDQANKLHRTGIQLVQTGRFVRGIKFLRDAAVLTPDDMLLVNNLGVRPNIPSYSWVTEKIYNTSQDRWRHYTKHLAPVMPQLKPWAEKFGYETE